MVLEFERYGLSKFRVLNGYLQILGALALLAGFFFLPFALAGSLGLSILMTMGLIVRIRLRDGFLKLFPAFFYMVLNMAIFLLVFKNHNV